MERILIVDDERGVRDSLKAVLGDEGFHADAVATGEECLARLEADEYEAVLLDIWLPRMDGLEVLEAIGGGPASPAVIIISGHGSIETAVRATKLGAFDFIEKPLSLDRTLLVVRNALRQRRLEAQNRMLRHQVVGEARLVGEGEAIRRMRAAIDAAAPLDGPVLIRGESGAGKERVARILHAASPRADEPFVEVRCAAFPGPLLESELFGQVRGAVNGAGEARRGQLELAAGGSLLLDEVVHLSLEAQARLQRALQDREFHAVGGSEAGPWRSRLLAATAVDLEEEVRLGRFRKDLLLDLGSVVLDVPALRDRLEDIPSLVGQFLDEFRGRHGRGPREFTADALAVLRAHRWPGNVRELSNLVERMVITVAGERVTREDLPASVRLAADEENPFAEGHSLRAGREIFERQFIRRALAAHGNNVTRTAGALGLERSHLHRKIKALGLDETGE